jgi:hypothetical protein
MEFEQEMVFFITRMAFVTRDNLKMEFVTGMEY